MEKSNEVQGEDRECHEHHKHHEKILPQGGIEKAIVVLLAITLIITGFNSYMLSGMASTSASFAPATVSGGAVQAVQAPLPEFMPQGVPDVYGKELGVSYDDVSPNDQVLADRTIETLGNLDRTIELSGTDLERYINVLYKLENGISCEYCCGARSVIFEDGSPACGCAHSFAMRGLTKYLITNHGAEYTDEQLLAEAGKWKMLFFPGAIAQKAQVLKGAGVDLNPITLASNKYRGAEQQAATSGAGSGGMVGGC